MKNTVIGIVIILLIFGGGIFIFSFGDNKSTVQDVSYSKNAKNKPIVEVKETNYDFGKIKVKDIKEKEFIIKNIGEKPLQLSKISSSCGCTAGKVIYNGRESKEFSMHSKGNEVFDIAPNTSVIVKVIYRPFSMPVSGQVEREVYVTTNDPQNQKLTFTVIAFVE